jgi:hypothetical protein
MQFRQECGLNVQAFDQSGAQTRVDPDTGETITASEDNELFQGVTGVISSSRHVTMTRNCDKRVGKPAGSVHTRII